jgi:DNA polymerase I-like protein with 3'-5' exonuclease and polymerase domains
VFEAREMIEQHRQLFGVYWQWVADWVARSLDTGIMWTTFDWQCAVGITEFNARSIGNFPVQASSADILRIAIVLAHRRCLRLLAPVHDALLIEAPIDRIEADVALLRDCMRRASRIVLNATPAGLLELRTSVEIVKYPNRYSDARGTEIWARVLNLLDQYQAMEGGHERTAIKRS